MLVCKWVYSVMALVGVLGWIIPLSSLAQAQDKTPIKIGATFALSGASAVNGLRYSNAVKLAVKKVNNEGGILGGRKIDLVYYDDKGVPDEAVSTIKKLINRDKVVACITGATSTPALATKEVTREKKMVHIITTAQHPKVTEEGHPYLFRLNTTIAMGGGAICKYVIDKLKPKTAWYLGINDEYGRFLDEQYKAFLGKAGIKILGSEFLNRSDTDFTVYLTKGKALRPDVFMMGIPPDSMTATVLRQRKQLGFTGLITQAAGVLTPAGVELAGDSAEGVYSADSWVRTLDNKENQWFIENYEKEYKPLLAGKQEATAYESLLFLVQAMNIAGSETDAEKIAHVFRTTTFSGPRGKTTFDKIGQAIAVDYPILVKNKKIVLAE